jgi:hypothetical protein
MGYNTVLVVYNDTVDIGAKDAEIGRRIHEAVRAWSVRSFKPNALDISAFAKYENGSTCSAMYGAVVSQEHADYSQVVVVGQNRGRRLVDCHDLDRYALGQIAEALIRHGWTVKPPKKEPRKRPKAA